MPASVCTAIRACTESSGSISTDQPPFGLSPNKGTTAIALMRSAERPARSGCRGWGEAGVIGTFFSSGLRSSHDPGLAKDILGASALKDGTPPRLFSGHLRQRPPQHLLH